MPTLGSLSGGTALHFIGRHLSGNSVECNFQQVKRPGFAASSTKVMCSTPAQNAGMVTVEVTVDGQESQGGHMFQYSPSPTITTVTPSIAFDQAKSIITVHGKNFRGTPTALCKFGQLHTSVLEIVSDTEVICRAPQLRVQNISISVSSNGQEFSRPSPLVCVIPFASILLAVPSTGQTTGGTMVTIFARKVHSALAVQCRFGNLSVPASMTSQNTLACVSPSLAGQTLDTRPVQLSLTTHGLAYTQNNVMFAYGAGSHIMSISPSFGTSEGHTPVIISISDFMPTNRTSCFCKFGVQLVGEAEAVSYGQAVCISPPKIAGEKMLLSIECNDVEILSTGLNFEYRLPVLVEGFLPRH
eukprot:834776-Rhodomonas_salina.1